MKPYSITRRLIATVLLIELASALCVTAVAYIYERHDHFRAFDILLRGRADSLLGAVQNSEDANDSLMLDNSEVDIPDDDIYEVRDTDNRILGHSANLPDFATTFQPEDERPGRIDPDGDQASFGKMRIGHKTYRVIRMLGVRTIDPVNAPISAPGSTGSKQTGKQVKLRRNVIVYYGASDRYVWRAIHKAVNFYALSSLIVLAVTGVLMAWVLNRSLGPLRELASRAAQVSVTSWTFTPPEDARRTRELAPLVTALESLLQGLQRSFEQQKRFVGDAAHELKTSVAVVKSSLQLLHMKPRSLEEYQSGLERCLADCQRMEEIVAQMLTLAQIEEGLAARNSQSNTDLFLCLREVAERLETMAEANRIPILTHGPQQLYANIDPEDFKLLCTNLLMNALQHSPPNSGITAQLYPHPTQAELRISDEGDGIDPLDLPHIFERFSRSDPSRSRKTGGTGLGLAIVKAIADKFNGIIQIHSEIGHGTTIQVWLPLALKEESGNPKSPVQ